MPDEKSEPYDDHELDELFIASEDECWITLQQGCVADGYVFTVDKSGRCFRMGQLDPSTGVVGQEIHVCHGELFHALLGKVLAVVKERWGDDEFDA
jgi:hypothetical protein